MKFNLSKMNGMVEHSFDIKANSLADAQSYRDTNYPGYSINEVTESVKTEKQKLTERREFGEQLYEEFILDNAKIATDRGSVITRQEGKALKNKVDDALEFVRAGSLELAKQELQGLQADAILTQTRIDKYISMITTFLNNQ